jgi:hypothetical protein
MIENTQKSNLSPGTLTFLIKYLLDHIEKNEDDDENK